MIFLIKMSSDFEDWVGRPVSIIGPYNSQADGRGTTNTKACSNPQYSLYLYKIHYNKPYPYQVKDSSDDTTIGFAKHIALNTFP